MDCKLIINLNGDFSSAQKLPTLMLDYESDIDLAVDSYVVDCKSLFGVLSLTTNRDLTLTIHEKVPGEADKIKELLKQHNLLVEQKGRNNYMKALDMINCAETNDNIYTSKYGTYSKKDGFKLRFDPHPSSVEPLINKLFIEDCWTQKIQKKKMSKAEIEEALGYEIEISDYEPKVKLTNLEQQAVDHFLKTFSNLINQEDCYAGN